MAKKGNRVIFGLTCESCGRQNYISEKNKLNTPSVMTFKKYCPQCRRRTIHKEKKKLH